MKQWNIIFNKSTLDNSWLMREWSYSRLQAVTSLLIK